jgi:hypothetical protein
VRSGGQLVHQLKRADSGSLLLGSDPLGIALARQEKRVDSRVHRFDDLCDRRFGDHPRPAGHLRDEPQGSGPMRQRESSFVDALYAADLAEHERSPTEGAESRAHLINPLGRQAPAFDPIPAFRNLAVAGYGFDSAP